MIDALEKVGVISKDVATKERKDYRRNQFKKDMAERASAKQERDGDQANKKHNHKNNYPEINRKNQNEKRSEVANESSENSEKDNKSIN
jgi:hypothetical protein